MGCIARWSRGFTLIELLVVVAIIALMVGILLPVLGGARAATRDVGCRASLNQMITGWHVLMVDRDGQIPNTINPTSPAHPLPDWAIVLEESMRSNSSGLRADSDRRRFLHCPQIIGQYGEVVYANPFNGYAINCRMRPDQAFGDNEGALWSAIDRPSAYPWFADPAVFSSPPIAKGYFAATPTDTWGIGFHHAGGFAQFAFCDGHVASFEASVLSGDTDAAGVPLWLLDAR